MPGLGHWWVLLILAAVALIVFGPSRLPELGAGLGKAIREFRKATTDMGDALKEEVHKPNETTPTAVGTTYTPPGDQRRRTGGCSRPETPLRDPQGLIGRRRGRHSRRGPPAIN